MLKVAAAYALAAWIFIEAGSVLLPTFGGSESLFRGYVILVFFVFVTSLILSWFFEFSDGGLQRKGSAASGKLNKLHSNDSRRVNITLVVMLVAALCVSLILNIFGFRDSTNINSRAADSLSIAVLPFSNISNDVNNVVFVDGIHDDLLTKLANVKAFRVISRTSVLAYKDTKKNIREIGKELGAQNILEGSIQRVGDRVRINMQLIESLSDEHLWAQTYDRKLTAKNIFDIQSEISTQITSALKTTLSDEEKARVTAVPTENIDAYRLFVSGRQNLHQRLYSSINIARTQFEQAIKLDPNYIDAYVGLAEAIMLLHINHNAIPPETAQADAQVAIDKAFKLNPDHADAFATQGLIYMQQVKSNPLARAKSEESFQRALELNPSNARAWMWYSSLVERMNDFERALEYNKKSLMLDPIGRIPHLNIGKLLSALNQNEAAVREFAKGALLHSSWPSIYQAMSNQLQRLGRLDESLAWARAGDALDDGPFKNANTIGILFDLGQLELAVQRIERISSEHPIRGIFDAYLQLGNGHAQKALELIDENYEENNEVLPDLLKIKSNVALIAGDLELMRTLVLKSHPEFLKSDPKVDRMNTAGALKLAYVWLQDGKQELAEDMLKKVLSVVADQPRLGLAGHGIRDVEALALLGRTDEALSAFNSAVNDGFVSPIAFDGILLISDVYLDSLRGHTDFIQQVEIIEQRKSQMRARVERAQTEIDWAALREISMSN